MPTDPADDEQGIKPPSRTPSPRPPVDDDLDDDELHIDAATGNRSMAIWSHWGGLMTWILIPLVFYLVEKDKRSFTAWHAREALTYQMNSLLHFLLATPLVCLMFIDWWLILVWVGVAFLFMVLELVLVTLASLAAWHGQRYRYPLMIPFIPAPSDESNPYVDRE